MKAISENDSDRFVKTEDIQMNDGDYAYFWDGLSLSSDFTHEEIEANMFAMIYLVDQGYRQEKNTSLEFSSSNYYMFLKF